jgi:hypothetical protein
VIFSRIHKLNGTVSKAKWGEGKKIVKRSVFEKIYREMQSIHFRLDDLEKHLSNWSPTPIEISESKLISLPDHLRKTYIFVASKGECDATQTSNQTGRCRALESNYLNQLSRMGWLNKRKVSKNTIYYLSQEKPIKEMNTRKAADAKSTIGQFESSYRKYFAEPLKLP